MSTTHAQQKSANAHSGLDGADRFRQLVRQEHTTMVRVARAFVRSADATDEVVQAAWLRAIGGQCKPGHAVSMRASLVRTVVDEARDRAEYAVHPHSTPRAPQHRTRPRSTVTSAGRAPGLAVRVIIEDALAELPADEQCVMLLRDVQHWTAAEVNTALGVNDIEQRALLQRARVVVSDTVARALDAASICNASDRRQTSSTCQSAPTWRMDSSPMTARSTRLPVAHPA